MTPTNRLRFVERAVLHHGQNKIIRILQQWWTAGPLDALSVQLGTNGEWRDVPLEEEA